jgi:hypothetical protein
VTVALVAAAFGPWAAPGVLALSTPTPNPPVTCPFELELDALPEDPALAIDALTGVAVEPGLPSDYQDVKLFWTAVDNGEGCIAVFHRAPGDDSFGAKAHTLLGPRQGSWAHWQTGSDGEHCYRLVAVSSTARGPAAETCISVARVAKPATSNTSFWIGAVAVVALIGGGGAVAWRRLGTN